MRLVSSIYSPPPPSGTSNFSRMILYFPVSALVTLFGNILQNPLDVRAKSDTRLMGLVVTFLSMLGQEAEQGGVHRMLGVCSEFVRIAKLVIEKAEKDQSFRRKRKTDGKTAKANGKNLDTSEVPIPTTIEELSPPVRNQRSSSWGPVAATSPAEDQKSPSATSRSGNPSIDFAQQVAHAQAHAQAQAHAAQQQQQQQGYPQNGDFESFNAMSGFPGDPSAMNMDAPFHHQPLLPQDLFALPMTLDWNWAEMSGGAYPSVENGNFGGDHQQQQ